MVDRTVENKVLLLELLDTHFNETELRELCFELDIDYENLAETTKRGKIREIISFSERRRKTQDLLNLCQKIRPTTVWRINVATSDTIDDTSQYVEYLQTELKRQISLSRMIHDVLTSHAKQYDRLPKDFVAEIEFTSQGIAKIEKDYSQLTVSPPPQMQRTLLQLRQHFVGREEELASVLLMMGPLSPYRLILIKGSSGVGKSALAREVALRAFEANLVDDIIILSLPNNVDVANRLNPIENLVDSIVEQADSHQNEDIASLYKTKLKQVHEILSKKKYAVIIDNLESNLYIRTEVIDFIRDAIPATTKVVVTSTHHLSQVDYIHNLRGMRYPESAFLMRRDAYLKSLKSIAFADYKLLRRAWSWASGLPLAMQWLVGYASESAIGFERILGKFERGDGQEESLLNQLFNTAFQLIREERSRLDVLFGLSVFVTHGTFESISYVSDVKGSELENALNFMYRLSLVQFDDLKEEYKLLPITRRFVIKSANNLVDLTQYYERAIEYYRTVFDGFDDAQIQSDDNLRFLNSERQNIMAILDWCIDKDKWVSFIDIGLKMNTVLGYSGMYPARLKYAYQLLKAAEQLGKPSLQAWILIHEIGWINQHMGNYDEAEMSTRRGLQLALDIHDKQAIPLAKRNLAILLYRRAKRETDHSTRDRQFLEGLTLCQEALQVYDSMNEIKWKAITLRLIGMIKKEMGQLDEAHKIFHKALLLHRQVHDLESVSLTISDLGELALLQNNLEKARDLLEEALSLDDKYNRPFGRGRGRQRLAHVFYKSGDRKTAERFMKEALEIFREMNAVKAIEFLEKDCKMMGISLLS